MSGGIARTASEAERAMESAIDRAFGEFSEEIEAVAAKLQARTADGAKLMRAGSRAHPTAYLETLVTPISVRPGCLCVGHTNTDMDSVAGAIGAAELYDGRACLSQPPKDLNGEIMYSIDFARSGATPSWDSSNVEAWLAAAEAETAELGGQQLRPFGSQTQSLTHFPEVFDAATSKVLMLVVVMVVVVVVLVVVVVVVLVVVVVVLVVLVVVVLLVVLVLVMLVLLLVLLLVRLLLTQHRRWTCPST